MLDEAQNNMSAEGSAYTDGKYEANSVIGLYITSRHPSGTIVAKSMSSGKQMLVVFMCSYLCLSSPVVHSIMKACQWWL
jgi:hypothetical protein